ncbi:MAG: PDDEXK nuclease domain-containing protein [Candidatus Moraniibacteriota bacterium]
MNKKTPATKNIKDQQDLFLRISNALYQARQNFVQYVNITMVETYFEVGKIIVEYEQKGSKKAEYGKEILKKLSQKLIQDFGKGFSVQNLERMRLFYLIFGKSQTVSAKSEKSSTLSRKLSWSHYVRLLAFADQPLKLEFYLAECEKSNWSFRELDRQIKSALFERVALSPKMNGLIVQNIKKYQEPRDSRDIFKEPYILEFLGLEEKPNYSESDFEQAILDNLQKFLLEFGHGFTFVARQKRLTFAENHYYVDIVLFNRVLQCFVLIDLKIDKLTHQDVGQMEMYVNYYDEEEKRVGEKPTIGLILCPENDEGILKYVLSNKSQIFSKEYRVILPNEKELKKLIEDTKRAIQQRNENSF